VRETGEGNGRRKGRGRGKEWKVTGRGNLLPLKFRSGYATEGKEAQPSCIPVATRPFGSQQKLQQKI